jgi:hypothetical protein
LNGTVRGDLSTVLDAQVGLGGAFGQPLKATALRLIDGGYARGKVVVTVAAG